MGGQREESSHGEKPERDSVLSLSMLLKKVLQDCWWDIDGQSLLHLTDLRILGLKTGKTQQAVLLP